MAFTRANAEAVLVRRANRKMVMAGFAITTAGSNADLDDPLATALRKMGFSASIPVVDGDFDDLADTQQDEFLARAELRLLENIHENLAVADISVGPRRESLGQIVDQTDKAIERLSARIEKEFGAGLMALTAGTILKNSTARAPEYWNE